MGCWQVRWSATDVWFHSRLTTCKPWFVITIQQILWTKVHTGEQKFTKKRKKYSWILPTKPPTISISCEGHSDSWFLEYLRLAFSLIVHNHSRFVIHDSWFRLPDWNTRVTRRERVSPQQFHLPDGNTKVASDRVGTGQPTLCPQSRIRWRVT